MRDQGRAWLFGRQSRHLLLIGILAACSRTQTGAPLPPQEEPIPSNGAAAGRADTRTRTPVAQAPVQEPEEVARTPSSIPSSQEAPKESAAVTAADCRDRVESNLPGAAIRVTTKRCSFSRSELSAGVPIAYELGFEEPLHGLRPRQAGDLSAVPWPGWAGNFEGACFRPNDGSNLVVAYWISDGAEQIKERRLWCPGCPGPRCPPMAANAVDLKPGSYRRVTDPWTGSNTLGSVSFPPGEYQLTLRADGSYLPGGAKEPRTFHMQTTRPLTVTP